MAVIGNAPFQGLVSGGNILDASIEGVDLSTSAIAARLGYTPVDPGNAAFSATLTAKDIQQDNATYIKGKLAAGTATRLFGMNGSDTLYIGSVDANHTGGTLFVKNGVTQMILDANGRLGIANSSPAYTLDVGGTINSTGLQMLGTGSDILFGRSEASAYPMATLFRKARGTTSSPTTVNNGDGVGIIYFQPYVATSGYIFPAYIQAAVNGTVSGTTAPVDLTFGTGSSSATERMRIQSDGAVLIGTGTTQSSAGTTSKLVVYGTTPSTAGDINLRLYDSGTSTILQLMRSGSTYNYAGIGGSESAVYTTSTLNLTADGGIIKFSTGSTGSSAERARIDASGNMALGVTTTSRGRLTVSSADQVFDGWGTINALSSSTTADDKGGSIVLGGENSQGTTPYVFGKIKGGKETGGTWNGYLAFGTTRSNSAVVEAMRIDSQGNVGVGTTTPNSGYKLTIASASNTARIFQYQTATQADINSYVVGGIDLADVPRDGVASNPAAYVRFVNKNTNSSFPTQIRGLDIVFGTVNGAAGQGTSASERMRITANGAVGIGTANPAIEFEVYNRARVGDGTNTITMGYWDSTTNRIESVNKPLFLTSYNDSIRFGISGSENMRIHSSGAVLINDTGTAYSAKLYVNGSIAARNGGVDGTYADAFISGYTGNYNEKNIIQTAVSSGGTGSGFRFKASDGAGLASTTNVLDLTRSQTTFYTNGTERAKIDVNGKTTFWNATDIYGQVNRINGNQFEATHITRYYPSASTSKILRYNTWYWGSASYKLEIWTWNYTSFQNYGEFILYGHTNGANPGVGVYTVHNNGVPVPYFGSIIFQDTGTTTNSGNNSQGYAELFMDTSAYWRYAIRITSGGNQINPISEFIWDTNRLWVYPDGSA